MSINAANLSSREGEGVRMERNREERARKEGGEDSKEIERREI